MGNSAPKAPDPTVAAGGELAAQLANYPFEQLISELAQTGGTGTATNPATGLSQTYNFSGLGTADVQNAVSEQMAQTLLGIQQNLGPQYIALALQNLQQSDPQGYAAYKQLFDQIQTEASQNPPDQPLSEQTQSAINNILQNSQTLTPEEQQQSLDRSNAGNVASGITLGNAPEQANVNALVSAADQQQQQAEGTATQYLNEGVTPADISYRTLQQNLSNLGNFINGVTPTSEFSSISGASSGAAPIIQTGYQPQTINEGQTAQAGVNLQNELFGTQSQLESGTANPYLAGLNLGISGLTTGLNVNPNLFGNLFGNSTNNSFQDFSNTVYGLNTNYSDPFFGSADIPSTTAPTVNDSGLTDFSTTA